MGQWTVLETLMAGAYIAIMLAVLGVPQMISSYFDLRARRLDRLENESNAERRHREALEERREERLREEDRRREERALEEERRRHDAELAERRHQEMMALILASINHGRDTNETQNELIRTLQETVTLLQAENARLRHQNGNPDTSN